MVYCRDSLFTSGDILLNSKLWSSYKFWNFS